MILLIDNYDSFTWNLFQALGVIADGEEIRVLRNDACPPEALAALRARRVVLSPGPGHPRDSGLSLLASDLLPDTPLLGVCLGHQALGLAAGAHVERTPRPTHGRAVTLHHDGLAPFDRWPAEMPVALYHSLVIQPAPWPAALEIAGRNDAGDIMAIRHRSRPHVGVQFHPESFMTTAGSALLSSFLDER